MEEIKKYGYGRVSTKEQNEGRQIEALLKAGVEQERIFVDKMSGKDFNRPEYITLKRILKDSKGSLLIIPSIDRLGRNYREIKEQWSDIINNCKADIRVIDMPLLDTTLYKDLLGTFISDLILQVLSFNAEQERLNIRKRQAEGIQLAQKEGKLMGRPKLNIDMDLFKEVYEQWKSGSLNGVQAIQKSKMKKTSFYKLVKDFEGGKI